ncbi:sensor histidine kinase [Planobispora takensis]|uniref:Sensor histidine kinase n=1 Tax=Planobispora takensis TaxID=1367882 RepID=A0A8J3WXZ7_9ACTN|nr:sensor domain-containing protein [Planobispora takensis]GII05348.1 hypothetical protein Pta02_73560 [Planobispora takensis]
MNIARWSPLNGRARAELAYVAVSLPVAVAGFFYAWLTTVGGIVLGLVSFGPVLLAGALTGAWRLGAVHRWLAARLLGVMVTAFEGVPRRPGVGGWITSNLRDVAAWRTLIYLLLKGPLGIAEAMAALTTWGYGLAYLSHPLWRPAGPSPTEADGYPILIGDLPFDGWLRPFLNPVLGAAMLLAAPWAVRAVLLLDMALLRALLGPTASARRIRHLEETRTYAVEESAERLRRIERDLHDGAQVRLVTLAMHLGAAKERLAELPEVDPALEGLISGAHQNAKDALVELRSLVRGIHPPILDSGLEAALTTLAACGSVPYAFGSPCPSGPRR